MANPTSICSFSSFRSVTRAGFVWISLWLGVAAGTGAPAAGPPRAAEYAEDRIMVRPKPATTQGAMAALHAAQRGKLLRTFEGIGGLQVIGLPAGETVPGFVAKYQ